MSSELLNLYTNATLPHDFTGLDRHLLEHYCNRHIDNLGKAFVGMPELVRIFNCDDKSLLRSRRRLIKAGALIPITKGFPGQCSEFAVSKKFLLEHQQVTDGLPVTRNRLPSKPEQVTVETVTSDPTVTDRSPSSYPRLENNKTKTQQVSSYSSKLLELIPGQYRFSLNATILDLLSMLEHKGTSFKAVEALLPVEGWDSMNSPKAVVTQLLRDLVARPPDYSMDNKPPWCGKCDEETRKNNYTSPVPFGDGTMTLSCINCNPYMVLKKHREAVLAKHLNA
jgi:hypothetical protein